MFPHLHHRTGSNRKGDNEMNEPKFTKGEWMLPHFVTAKEQTDCMCQFVLNDHYCGCIAIVEYGDVGNPPIEEAKANSHLICSAPDMFRVLNELIQIEDWCYHPDIWDEAKKAIMKAMGEVKL